MSTAAICWAFWLLVGLAAGQALPPGCNPDSVGEQLAELELSLDSNATWTGPLVRAEANDVDFAYFEFGNASGPTVVLINGFGTTMAEWGPILPQLLAQASQVPTLVRLRIVFPADQIHEAAASALMLAHLASSDGLRTAAAGQCPTHHGTAASSPPSLTHHYH